jgi:predicted phosphodiesterase
MTALLLLALLLQQSSPVPSEVPTWRTARVPQSEIRSFDVSLVPAADTMFAVVSDTHIEPEGPPFRTVGMDDPTMKFVRHTPSLTNNARFVRAVEQINRLGADFTVHLGDIVRSMPFGPSFDLESRLSLSILDRLEAPYYLAPGNHDIGNKPSMEFRENPPLKMTVCDENTELYRSIFGDPFLSWDHEGSHFIVLNTMAFNSGIANDAEQWEWLLADLEAHKTARNIFMFGHVGLYWASPDDIGFHNYEVIDEPARSRLLELVDRYDIDAVYTGHTHHMFRNRYGDAELITAPSTAFTRNTWALYPQLPARTMDAAKLAYLLVRLGNGRVVTQHLRITGGSPEARSPQAAALPLPSRVLTLQSTEARGARLLVEAPAPQHIEAGWQAHDVLDGFLDMQPGMNEGQHAWRSYAGIGAFDFPIEMRIELAEEHEITEVRLHRARILADWVVESSLDGGTWEPAGRGEADLPADLPTDVVVPIDPRRARFLRLVVDDEMPPKGSFIEMTVAEFEALDSHGINRASANEGGRARANGFGATPRESIRDQGWLAAYDIANRHVRVATHGNSSWDRVEYRRGAYRVPPDLARALDAGAKEGLELSLPLSLGHPAYRAESGADVEAFAAYCRFLAEQVGEDVALWELSFISKNAAGKPSGRSVPVDDFVRKFRAMRRAVITVRPDARFALSGVPLGDPLLTNALLRELGGQVDRVSVDPPNHQLGVGNETITDLMEMVAAQRKKAPDVQWSLDLRPLEVSNRPVLGAARLARAFLRLQDAGILLGVRLDGATGLLDAVEDPYEAWYSLRLLATLFDGGLDPVSDPPVFLEGHDLVQTSYRRDDGSWLVAAWAVHRVEELRAHLVVPAGRTATAYDTLTCTSQELRIAEVDGRSVAPSVMLRTYPTVFVVR